MVRSIILWSLVTFLFGVMIAHTFYMMGYGHGQRDAIQGIYELSPQLRDELDPEGLHHHLQNAKE